MNQGRAASHHAIADGATVRRSDRKSGGFHHLIGLSYEQKAFGMSAWPERISRTQISVPPTSRGRIFQTLTSTMQVYQMHIGQTVTFRSVAFQMSENDWTPFSYAGGVQADDSNLLDIVQPTRPEESRTIPVCEEALVALVPASEYWRRNARAATDIHPARLNNTPNVSTLGQQWYTRRGEVATATPAGSLTRG
jgi:hypothetical protein